MSEISRTEDVTRVLREEVLRGQYRAGERLPSERELASRFETTRGVARIALKKLEQMGMVAIQPGGARVQPLGESSLEVIGHLIELESPPDPNLVDQVLEVVGALVAANVRMTIERAESEKLERVEELIAKLGSPDLEHEQMHQIVHDFAHAFMDATDNLVMRIVRRDLRTEILSRLEAVRESARAGGVDGQNSAATHQIMLAGFVDVKAHIEAFSHALETRDGLAGYEAVHQIWTRFRASVRQVLETSRENAALPRRTSAGALP
ncbi:MAG: FadR family transcriptional regulator [bacterium]|nr:FadR family transcriptional regulator [bacterium]